jgi:hypothetical protein
MDCYAYGVKKAAALNISNKCTEPDDVTKEGRREDRRW